MDIINFMVYCNEHMFFHKSIDASNHEQSAVIVLDPDTYYKFNFSKNLEYALGLIDAIEKMSKTPDNVVEAIKEIVAFRECHEKFNSGNKKGKTAMVDEEIEFEKSEDEDEEDKFKYVSSGSEDNSDHGFSIDELGNRDNDEQDKEASLRVEQDI
ncbi:hypothetical protein ABZP36_008159 [Zizania latifolia]